MVDLRRARFTRLSKLMDENYAGQVKKICVEGESVQFTFEGSDREAYSDGKFIYEIAFTDRRVVFSIHMNEMEQKNSIKRRYTSLMYKDIKAFTFDNVLHRVYMNDELFPELTLWFTDAGKVEFEFQYPEDINSIVKIISNYIVK